MSEPAPFNVDHDWLKEEVRKKPLVPLVDVGYERWMIQARREIELLTLMVKALHPQRCLEIGTHRGGTLTIWAQIATHFAIGIDVAQCSISHPRARFVLGHSQNPSTLSEVASLLDGHKLDFLFIDGDHSYTSCREDFETYEPMVRSGGLVAFHDIGCHHPPEFEVGRFWEMDLGGDKVEINARCQHEGRQVCGIGVWRKP